MFHGRENRERARKVLAAEGGATTAARLAKQRKQKSKHCWKGSLWSASIRERKKNLQNGKKNKQRLFYSFCCS